jgi:hypothetical protein
MSLQVHGAIIDKNTSLTQVSTFDVMVQLQGQNSLGQSAMIKMARQGEIEEFLHIPVLCPFGYILNQNNWAEFLFYFIQSQPNRVWKNDISRAVGSLTLTCRYYLGHRYFQIKHSDYSFGMLVTESQDTRRDTFGSKTKSIESICVFDHTLGNDVTAFHAEYSNDSLVIVPVPNAFLTNSEHIPSKYVISFSNTVPPAEMLIACIKGDASVSISPEMFSVEDAANDQKNRTVQLIRKNIGQFYYLESFDHTVRCSIDKDGALQAIHAIVNFIDAWPCSDYVRTKLHQSFVGLQKSYVASVLDIRHAYLSACVAFKQEFNTITGFTILDDGQTFKEEPSKNGMPAHVEEAKERFMLHLVNP